MPHWQVATVLLLRAVVTAEDNAALSCAVLEIAAPGIAELGRLWDPLRGVQGVLNQQETGRSCLFDMWEHGKPPAMLACFI